ncbi:hypothetical protein L195_g006402, partial [Trifolium pratense]
EPPRCHSGVAAAIVMHLYHTNGSHFSVLELRNEDATFNSTSLTPPTKYSPPLSLPLTLITSRIS